MQASRLPPLSTIVAAVTDHPAAIPSVEADADLSARRIAFYADGGLGRSWPEEPFAAAEVGPVLSEALGSEVITLEARVARLRWYTHVFVRGRGRGTPRRFGRHHARR